ncbi:H-X9-DG-CTERM domain-containing protein, partial [Armatimonas sp.]|uniref:H-X9-DG-CTERM domain-containing protein n=1 Tax=Armatimonas sp. TaxID=1872638 RepID=UPI002869FD72
TRLATAATTENWGSYSTNTTYWNTEIGTPPSSESNNTARQTTMSMVGQPADTIWAMEGNGGFQVAWSNIQNQPRTIAQWNGYQVLSLVPSTNQPTFFREGGITARHQGRLNVVWCDGHAGTIDLRRLMTPGTTCITPTNPPNITNCAYRFLTIEED